MPVLVAGLFVRQQAFADIPICSPTDGGPRAELAMYRCWGILGCVEEGDWT